LITEIVEDYFNYWVESSSQNIYYL
jgi:hypothetical protein